ncbi:MAG: protein translocase SEC61 complex subunit gamma [Candidatus Bathyarchaeia archaeon]
MSSGRTMGLRSFLSQCARTLKLAVKPGKSELWLSIKICFIGLGAVGVIGFIIKMLASAITGGTAA